MNFYKFLFNNILYLILTLGVTKLLAQVVEVDSNYVKVMKDTVPKGVSVSPSSMRFAIKPGSSQSRKINVINDTDVERTFEVKSQNYGAEDINRAAADSKTTEDFKFGLTKWTYITPAVFTLKPKEKMSINVLIDIPMGSENLHAAWSLIVVEEVKQRQPLSVNTNGDAMGLGIVPTFGFGIFVYQNPPGLPPTEVALTTYKISDDKGNFIIKAKNTGEGIGFCTYYVELMNMATGKIEKMAPSQATILPGVEREFKISIPSLPSGSYNAMVVLDYGSKEMVESAELDFAIP
jgi:P pilus assembly chaperone PapD